MVERGHAELHLGEDLARMGVVPIEPKSLRKILNDPDILARLARQRQRLAPHLDLAIGVADGAVFFRPGRGRQHDVGIARGLGQEQILHHEMLELRQRLAGMLHVGIRHRRVLAHDVHAADHIGVHGIHDLDHGQAALRIELGVPQLLVECVALGILDREIIGIEHRDEPDIRRALHVVLAAQRMEAGAGPADLAGDQRQRDQAARVVGAVDVLRDAHAPEDDRGLGARIFARYGLQRRGVDAANLGHLLRRAVLDAVLQLVEIHRVRLDVLLVVEILGDDDVEHRRQHGDVARRLELQHVRRVALQGLTARIHDDQRLAGLLRLLHEGRRDRVILGRVGADDDDELGVLDRGEGRGHRARADAFDQPRHRRGVAESRAVIDVVGAEAGTDQLLEEIGLLVGALGRAEARQRLAAMLVADAL